MTLKEHVINAVAAAAAIGASSTLITTKVNDARQDQRIERLEDLDDSVDGLRADLQKVDLKLERLNGKIDGEHEPRH